MTLTAIEQRDRDWILAMATALGMGSGFAVPIVPNREAFETLFHDIRTAALARPGWKLVPVEIDRSKHGHVVLVWNDCMINHETLEMTWPKLVKAMSAAPEPQGGKS